MEDGLDRAPSRRLTNLKPALKFLRPYVPQVAFASAALVLTAAVTLSIGQGMRLVIDRRYDRRSAASTSSAHAPDDVKPLKK